MSVLNLLSLIDLGLVSSLTCFRSRGRGIEPAFGDVCGDALPGATPGGRPENFPDGGGRPHDKLLRQALPADRSGAYHIR